VASTRLIPDDPLLVGVDLGSTTIKAVVYDARGRTVAHASAPTVTHYPQPTWAYFDPDELWYATCAVLRESVGTLEAPARIASVAVASFAEAGVPVEAAGNPVYSMIGWFDRRTIPQMEWLRERIGEDRLFAVTGLALQPIFSLCKLMWIRDHHPEAWSRAVRWLMAADYIAWKLSGAQATDYSLASRSLAFDIANRRWDHGILTAAGIAPEMMAPVVQSGERVGLVTQEAAAATGLPAGAVVGAGGHDHVCGAFAAGVIHADQMLDSMGTAEALFFPREEPFTDPEIGRLGYTQGAHVVSGKNYILGGLYTSGASVEWLRDVLGHAAHEALIAEADAIPAGSMGVAFVPHLRLANAPTPDPRARAAFIGMTTDVTRGVLMRAVFEGLGYEARATIEPVVRFSGFDRVPEVFVIGGSSRNELLLRIKSTILGVPFSVVDLDEATALGAAMLGGLAAGIYTSAADALAAVRPHPRRIEPDRDQIPFYDAYFDGVYRHVYAALRPLNHHIHELVTDDRERVRPG
jgi:xylulokinase